MFTNCYSLFHYGNIFLPLVRPDLIPRIVGGAVVDDDQLEVALILAEGAVDGLDEVFGVVVIQDVEGDGRKQNGVKC